MNITIPSYDSLLPDRNKIKAINALYNAFKQLISGGISKENLAEDVQEAIDKAENAISTPEGAGSPGQVLQLDGEGVPSWVTPSAGTVPDAALSESSTNAVQNKVIAKELNDNYAKKDGYYESMGVGTAVNLAGQVERTNDSLYRTSGGSENIATGTARIEGIKGQTIAWNQCVNVTDGSQSSKGITMSCQDGVLSVSGAFDGTTTSVDLGRVEFKCVDTHKYYLYIPNKLMSKLVLCNVGGSSSSYSYDNIKVIKTANVTKDNAYALFRYTTPNVTLSGSTTINIFDLTLIYGAGNEPSTPEQFEADYQKWFGKPLTYEPYDAGSLKNVMLSGLKTIGFNQYNPTTGTANVIGGNQYQITGTYTALTLNGETITPDSNGKFTPTIGGTLTVTGGSTDTCVHLVWSGTKDGTYEPYEENTISIPTTTMTGKLNGQGESVVIFPDGMKGVNDVHDDIYYVGGKTYAVKRIGRVDLGSLEWNISSSYYNSIVSSVYNDGKAVSGSNISSIKCAKYITKNWNEVLTQQNPSICYYQTNGGNKFFIRDDSYSDASVFTTAMSGVYLDYELETPLVYEVDDFTLPARYRVNDWGTEEQLQATGANGIAAIISCLYGVNAVDLLRRLPSTYISTESMDNFLAALGTAMGGTWTKTWNDTTEEYDFSFVANSQPDNSLQSTNEGE